MPRNPYKKNILSASNGPPVGKEVLRATGSFALLPEAETPSLMVAGPGSRIQKTRTQPMPSPTRIDQFSPLEIYLVYARDSERYFKKIKEQLDILQRQGWPIFSHGSEIIHNTEWQKSDHLSTANFILLLVSTAFLNSDFCYSDQMYFAVERHRTDKLCYVIPIILHPLHPLLLEKAPFGNLDFLPGNGKPISSWKDPREAYADITGYLIEKIQRMAYYRQS
jgi:hypothetical protein